jgi:transposase
MDTLKREANRARWLEHVNEWSKSGLTQSAYCRQHGLRADFFSGWIERKASVGRSGAVASAATMVPLVLEAEHASDETSKAGIVLRHKNGRQLHLASDTPAVWLGSLLKQLT